ncbi:unnamed protein product [Haemonchus placei]|uniref:Ovule protein n=1 Tax=Haemonchus placei TaxID=6290 RepID=A0A0N4WEH3_HAEPC|nr:unnamed protein product [Haemonchus placei]
MEHNKKNLFSGLPSSSFPSAFAELSRHITRTFYESLPAVIESYLFLFINDSVIPHILNICANVPL